MYYSYNTLRAGLTKRTLIINKDKRTIFSYTEKGTRNPKKPSIVFVHGLSSNKETWIPIIKNIPDSYHCICIDLPGHGETIGFNEEIYSIEKFADKLKLFFDNMNLIEPMCIVGASMGGTIVSMFALKYPKYVSMICLLAPIANEESETELIKQLKTGDSTALLPETPEQLRRMINTLAVKRVEMPNFFVNGFLDLRLRLLEEHKKVLSSLNQYESLVIKQSQENLKNLRCPTLVLWGDQDRLYLPIGAEYFCALIPNSNSIILEDCGHFMAIDKPIEVALAITTFYEEKLKPRKN